MRITGTNSYGSDALHIKALKGTQNNNSSPRKNPLTSFYPHPSQTSSGKMALLSLYQPSCTTTLCSMHHYPMFLQITILPQHSNISTPANHWSCAVCTESTTRLHRVKQKYVWYNNVLQSWVSPKQKSSRVDKDAKTNTRLFASKFQRPAESEIRRVWRYSTELLPADVYSTDLASETACSPINLLVSASRNTLWHQSAAATHDSRKWRCN